MPNLTPVDYDPLAGKGPSSSASVEPVDSKPKLTPVDHDPFEAKPEEVQSQDYYEKDSYKKDRSSFGKGVDIGRDQFGLGFAELMNQIGTEDYNVGKIMPVFVNGKLTFGYPPQEELAQKYKKTEARAEDLDIIGKVGKFIMDPTLLAGGEGKTIKGAMAAQAGISSLLAPSSSETQTVGNRLSNTGLSTALGYAGGKGLEMAAPVAKNAVVKAGEKLSELVSKLGPEAGAAIKKAGEYAGKGFTKATGEESPATAIRKVADKLGLKFTGKEDAAEVWGKITNAVEMKAKDTADKISPGASTSSIPEANYNLAISSMYGATKQAGGMLYDTAKDMGAKLSAPAEGFVENLDKLIADMEKNVDEVKGANPKFGTALKAFRELRDSIAEGGEEHLNENPMQQMARLLNHGGEPEKRIRGDQLIELDQALNENFGRTGFEGKTGRMFAKLQEQTKGAIKQMDPEFGKAYEKASNYWRQNVIQKFEENPSLKAIWDPEDFQAFNAMQKGIELHPALLKRAEGFLDKIKTPVDMEQLKNALPPEMYDRLRAAKFLRLLDQAGLNAKLIGDEKNYAMLSKALEHKPEDMMALDTIKMFADEMNERGLGKELTAEQLKKSDRILDQMQRVAFSFATGHKLYGLRHMMEMLTGETGSTIQGRVTGTAKEIAKGGVSKKETSGVIPNVVGRVGAAKGGEEVPEISQ